MGPLNTDWEPLLASNTLEKTIDDFNTALKKKKKSIYQYQKVVKQTVYNLKRHGVLTSISSMLFWASWESFFWCNTRSLHSSTPSPTAPLILL